MTRSVLALFFTVILTLAVACSCLQKTDPGPLDRGFMPFDCQGLSSQLKWRPTDYPIHVYTYQIPLDAITEIKLQALRWNEEVGSGLFMVWGDLQAYSERHDGRIRLPAVLIYVAPQADQGRTELWWDEDCTLKRAVISLPGIPMDEETLRRVILHELGHALGLDHDESPDSVMYPYAHPGPYRITDDDLSRLR